MNLGLVTSFIIAGVLTLSILTMNINFSHSSTKLTMSQITQQRTSEISDILRNDIPKIGYNGTNNGIKTEDDALTDASSTKIEFESDIDNEDSDIETVRWEFKTSSPVNSTKNPNDYILTRTVNGGQTEIKNGVTNFQIVYYDEDWNKIDAEVLGGSQAERNKVRHIKISLTVQSPEPIGGANNIDTEYLSSTWEQTFSPINLRL